MDHSYEKYRLLETDEDHDDYSERSSGKKNSRLVVLNRKLAVIAGLLFLLSLSANFMWATTTISSAERRETEISEFAGLQRNVSTEWHHRTEYTGGGQNDTAADELWDRISINEGALALTDEYVKMHNLPAAQPFPWDKEKSIYLLNGYHNLHCLIKVRKALREFQQGIPLSAPIYHSFHCLDALRMEVLCNADDTPRYTGMDQENKASGSGQMRMCKDWSQMEKWATSRSACWRYRDEQHRPKNILEQYQYCPNGWYHELITAYFAAEEKTNE